MSENKPELRVGTSGWQYKHWHGPFYPDDVPMRRWFEVYSQWFDCVEVNASFYNLPLESTFDKWREQAPPNFRYILKYSRFGTHWKRLLDPHEHLDIFLERAERLGEALGPILVQLPPRWEADPACLDEFLEAAPSRHRWAVEVRDASWLNEAVYDVLRKHNAALCIHDILPNHPWEITANWTYLRYHGAHKGRKYAANYSTARLKTQAARIQELLKQGYDVYAFFNNDANAYAVDNALKLRELAEACNPNR